MYSADRRLTSITIVTGRSARGLYHVTPLDDCERTATAALPTAAIPGFILGELGTSAALDAFSTVYELRRRLTNLFLALISSAVFHRQRYRQPE